LPGHLDSLNGIVAEHALVEYFTDRKFVSEQNLRVVHEPWESQSEASPKSDRPAKSILVADEADVNVLLLAVNGVSNRPAQIA
jgi:hypothetical protein